MVHRFLKKDDLASIPLLADSKKELIKEIIRKVMKGVATIMKGGSVEQQHEAWGLTVEIVEKS